MQSAESRIAEWRRPLLAHCLGCKRSCELTALGSTEPWLVGKANIYLREHTTSRIFECGQLAQEDLLGRVESVDDEAHQLVDLCLEGEGLGLFIFGHCVGRCWGGSGFVLVVALVEQDYGCSRAGAEVNSTRQFCSSYWGLMNRGDLCPDDLTEWLHGGSCTQDLNA